MLIASCPCPKSSKWPSSWVATPICLLHSSESSNFTWKIHENPNFHGKTWDIHGKTWKFHGKTWDIHQISSTWRLPIGLIRGEEVFTAFQAQMDLGAWKIPSTIEAEKKIRLFPKIFHRTLLQVLSAQIGKSLSEFLRSAFECPNHDLEDKEAENALAFKLGGPHMAMVKVWGCSSCKCCGKAKNRPWFSQKWGGINYGLLSSIIVYHKPI